MSDGFDAFVVEEKDQPAVRRTLTDADLPDGDVTIDVAYSSLNYKDGLVLAGKGRIPRSFPMVAGIDLAGTVSASDSADWKVGDEVVVTGVGLSETHPGGFTARQRVSSDMIVRRPDSLTLQQCMGIGTGGFTAMLSVLHLERAGVKPDSGPVLVTGSGGGVGNFAVALLAKAGYQVVAATGRPQLHDRLTELGASSFVGREDLSELSKRPLEGETYAGAVDTVGGDTLASVLKQIKRSGAVAACGNAGGIDVPTTVLPFILRGVQLLGVDSVHCAWDLRLEAWQRLAADLEPALLDSIYKTKPFDQLPELGNDVLAGKIQGRVAIEI